MDGTCQICHKPADIKTWPDGNYCWDHYHARNKKREEDARVKCYFCHKPIHISKLAGFFGGNGKSNAFCNNTVCLVAFSNWDKENNVKLCDDFKSHDLSVANEGTEEHDHTSAN